MSGVKYVSRREEGSCRGGSFSQQGALITQQISPMLDFNLAFKHHLCKKKTIWSKSITLG